jgi:hypothetical protein
MLSDLAIATDWFELACLAQSRPLLRHSEIQRVVALADPDMDLDQFETAVSDILAEVQRRSVRAGALYPFTTGLRGLHRRAVEPGVELLYKFLALCSVVPSFRSNQVGFQPGRAFERIAAPAMAAFVAGESVVFADIDEPGVRARIRSLGRMMYIGTHETNARPSRNDHGLDVASWRPFGDRRAAHPVVLCQCTLKRTHTDLILKAREIAPGEWGRLLDVREGVFSAALAIPHALEPGYEHWDELRSNTDLIVERVRLLSLLEDIGAPWQPLLAEESFIHDGFARWQRRMVP